MIVVEGINDIEFLTRLSRILAQSNLDLPDLGSLAEAGYVVFLPFGGGSPTIWTDRLAPLGCPEFHLYDREAAPETRIRKECIERVQCRSGCQAYLTSKRALENYLHPLAIQQAGGGNIEFGDEDCVGEVLARHWHERQPRPTCWVDLSRRRRLHWIHRAKRWLNTVAVGCMTEELLAASDTEGEFLGWLKTIASMLPPDPSVCHS